MVAYAIYEWTNRKQVDATYRPFRRKQGLSLESGVWSLESLNTLLSYTTATVAIFSVKRF